MTQTENRIVADANLEQALVEYLQSTVTGPGHWMDDNPDDMDKTRALAWDLLDQLCRRQSALKGWRTRRMRFRGPAEIVPLHPPVP